MRLSQPLFDEFDLYLVDSRLFTAIVDGFKLHLDRKSVV